MEKITRFGVSIETVLLNEFDRTIKRKGYTNRSEAIRDVIRKNLIHDKIKDKNAEAIGTLTMMYDHHTRNLTNKLLNLHFKEKRMKF